MLGQVRTYRPTNDAEEHPPTPTQLISLRHYMQTSFPLFLVTLSGLQIYMIYVPPKDCRSPAPRSSILNDLPLSQIVLRVPPSFLYSKTFLFPRGCHVIVSVALSDRPKQTGRGADKPF